MPQPARIYLDNAATSWPKPESVYAAVDRYQRHLGAPAGRSSYREAVEVERLVADARRRAADLLHAEEPCRVVFAANATDALNLALHGAVQPGDHVITSVAEHNSVLRPLRFLEENRGIAVSRVACDGQGFVDPDDIRRALRPETRLIALIHASNVTGAIQPVAEVGRIAREHGLLYLVDAAQSLGHVELDVRQIGAHLLAAAGHKGLLGPLGVGLLYIAPGVEARLEPLRQGGTGTRSDEDRQPPSLPDRYEAGNHNVPGIVGLGAGLTFLAERGVARIRQHQMQLTARLLEGLRVIAGVTLFGPADLARRLGVVSMTVRGYDSQELAVLLDAAYHIQTRAGLHCAPRMHQALGTAAAGGTVRFSPGAFNTLEEMDAAIQAVGEILAAKLH
jgi:cysteine desulfurase family protein